MDADRTYPHFCMVARALDEVGERWSLLIVRDLLLGPRRFTDLARSLSGITPTRLTNRLRSLERAGIVLREPPTVGREVWYRLTEAGHDLAPVVEALALWGIEHALEPPKPGDPVHPDHVMLGTKVLLNRQGVQPNKLVSWVWRFPGDEHYTLQFDGSGWALTRGLTGVAAVTVIATPEAWARFLTGVSEAHELPNEDIQVQASRPALRAFAEAFDADVRST